MKVIVTGGTGFLGTEIVNSLLENLHTVICLARSSAGVEQRSGNLNFFQADISNENVLENIGKIKSADIFIHCAGLAHQFRHVSPEHFWKVNVQGTINAVKSAIKLKCRRFILISSVAVYGSRKNIEAPLDEVSVCEPHGVYAESKFESENVCRKLCLESDLPLSILRPATIVGEFDRGNVFRLIRLIDRGLFIWVGTGENRKSLIYKKDVAAAVRLLAERSDENYEVFNLSANPVSMKEIVETIAENLNKKIGRFVVKKEYLDFVFRLNGKSFAIERIKKLDATLQKWLSDEVFSAELIRNKYGFEPQTPLKKALALETDWYLRQK